MGFLNNIRAFFGGEKISNKIQKRAFQVAKKDRLTSSWTTSYSNINQDIRTGNQIMRARARDLAENDPYARKFLRMLEKNVVGPDGFTHRNKAFDLVKDGENWVKKYDKFSNTIIEDAFQEWQKKEFCTITGDISFREACNLEIKAIATDGEVFIKKITGSVNKFGFAYQLIESQMCDETYNGVAKNGNQIIMGIEYNSVMKPTAYYFRTEDRRNFYYTQNSKSYVRIPASQIIHLYRKEFVGQLRGISWFLPTAYRMQILKGYQEAVLLNARSSAMKNGVLIPKDNPEALSEANVSGAEVDESTGDLIKDIAPGETYVVPEGYDFEKYDPTYPAGTEGGFTTAIIQGIASGFDVDYATLASDFSKVNYTSSRSALLDARASYKILQSFLIEHKLTDIRSAWLEMALLSGAIDLSISDFEKFNKPTFVGYKGDWVDQWKENKADAFGVASNLETLEKTLGKRGYSLEEFIEQKKYEKQLLDEAGLQVTNYVDEEPPMYDDKDETEVIENNNDNEKANLKLIKRL